jgi:F-type H+-transporting ATPase subunit epsilon
MFKLYFAAPDKKIVSDMDLEEITLPGNAGELNILPGHAPLMTTLSAGILSYKLKNGESARMAISWGYCQISSDGVTVLAETAVHGHDLDEKVLLKELKHFEDTMATQSLDDDQWEKTNLEIARLRAEMNLLKEKAH